MRSTKAISTTDLMQMLTHSKAHAVMPSVEDLWKRPDGQIYEEEIYRLGRGLAPLALRPSGELKKGVLGRILCMTVDVRIIIMTIGGSLVQTSARNLSLARPTASPMSLIALLALDLNVTTNPLRGSRCTNGFSTGHRLTFLQIRWALQSCQCGEQVDEVAFSIQRCKCASITHARSSRSTYLA